MRIRPMLPFILSLMFLAPAMASAGASLPGQQPVSLPSSNTGEGAVDARQAERARLGMELQKLQEKLPAMEGELEQLRRNWILTKGRTPTREEIEEFEKKRAKGPVRDEDNPYLSRTPTREEIEEFEKKRAKGPVKYEDNPYNTKNPLSSPGRAREAYYKKLDDLGTRKQRITEIRKEMERLGP